MGCVITKFQFLNLFSHAWSRGMSIENIVAGFQSTGIYPFNSNAILDKVPSSGISRSSDMVSGDSFHKENEDSSAPSHCGSSQKVPGAPHGDSSQEGNEDPNVLSNEHAETV